jgi:signal transduction histidine kinase
MKKDSEYIEDNNKEASVPKLAHEFRTRLAVIKGALDNVTDGVFGKLNPEQKKSLLIAGEGVERMSELVEDLMASLAPGRARMRINRAAASIEDIVRHAVESINSLAYKEGISITARMPKTLPMVFCDPVKIEQVLLNLFRNSIKFTSRGGTVTVSVKPRGSLIEVNVSDTGVGIPERKLARLFDSEALNRFRTADGGYRTSGLGLIIVKDILDAHNSPISVKSEIGKGTNISFTLPKAD